MYCLSEKRGFAAVLLVALVYQARVSAKDWGNPWQPPEHVATAGPGGAIVGTHHEVQMLDVSFRRITAMAMDRQGRLLASDGDARQIKVIDPRGRGRVLNTFPLPFGPEALDVGSNGAIYCGGHGKIVHLSPAGKVLAIVDTPHNVASQLRTRRRTSGKGNKVSGLAVSDRYVFAAFGSGWSVGAKSKLFRFDLDLSHPKLLASGLRTCCQRCDLQVHDGLLYMAENGAHRVVVIDADGNVLKKWGAKSRTDPAGFGSCCNPMNLFFGDDGTLYTAESGLGRVKKYTVDGKFLGVVGTVGVSRFNRASAQAAACSNIAIACPPNGDRIYVMDFEDGRIRVLQRNPRH